jgi:preprotein translocase subunit SecE
MTEQTENRTGGSAWMDALWLTAAALLVLGGLTAFYVLKTQPMPVRALAVIAGVVLGTGAFAMSSIGRSVWQFALGSRVELRKMVWPTIKDTRVMTAIVIVVVVILGVVFWVLDMAIGYGTRHLLGTGA